MGLFDKAEEEAAKVVEEVKTDAPAVAAVVEAEATKVEPVIEEAARDYEAEFLSKLQSLFDAKLAEAHAWASKQGGMPKIVVTKEDLEVLK